MLNNHTFGAGGVQQTNVYEDTGGNGVPGSRFSDGPGSLTDYIGDPLNGQWSMIQVDNALSHTGRIDHMFIHIDPHIQDDLPPGGTNGMVLANCLTVAANGLEYDFVDVPFNGVSVDICVSNTSSAPLPVQLFARNGALPTRTTYDYTKTIPVTGDRLTINLADLPPLQAGTLFFAIVNSNAAPQDVCYQVWLTISLKPVVPVIFASTNKPAILDDAVSYSSIQIPENPHLIASAAVGVVLNHPRVSDLALTLISPTVRAHLHLLSRLAFALRDARLKEAVMRQAFHEEILAELHRLEEALPRK